MNRVVLRWSGIGLVICALAAIAVSLWLLLRMRNTAPVDGTYLSIALPLSFWGMAISRLGFNLWMRSTARWQSKIRDGAQVTWEDIYPLGVSLAFVVIQTFFLTVVATLTLVNGAFGMASADHRLLAADLLIVHAVITVLLVFIGALRFSFRRQDSVAG